jgi:hypothetical protein
MGSEKESNGEPINLAFILPQPGRNVKGKELPDFGGTMQPELAGAQGAPRPIMRQPG